MKTNAAACPVAFGFRHLHMNRSKSKRGRLPAPPEFNWGLVAAGLFVGILAGMIWKLTRGGHSLFLMQGGAVAGLLIGGASASSRFYQGQRRHRNARAVNQKY
jgi:hypothetical protein